MVQQTLTQESSALTGAPPRKPNASTVELNDIRCLEFKKKGDKECEVTETRERATADQFYIGSTSTTCFFLIHLSQKNLVFDRFVKIYSFQRQETEINSPSSFYPIQLISFSTLGWEV